jgi:hypothetical protein
VKILEYVETVPQKVVDQKTIILKARLSPDRAKSLGEEKKKDFFRKSRFFWKKPEAEVPLVGFSKYYEPFVVVGGKYSVDYCKRHFFEVKTDRYEDRIFIGGEEKRPEPFDPSRPNKMFKLIGEGRCHYENETFIILDRLKREVPNDRIVMAPFNEENQDIGASDFKKIDISVEEEIDLLKSKIVRRPINSDFIIKEKFEINDRMLIYVPTYELTYQNLRTFDEIIMSVDGVAGKFSISKVVSSANEKLIIEKSPSKPIPQRLLKISDPNNLSPIEPELTSHQTTTETINQKDFANQEKEETLYQLTKPKSEIESALFLAKNLLGRLGFKKRITPLKILQENDTYIVELGMDDRTAKVLVNTKTNEIKEYDIQKTESF